MIRAMRRPEGWPVGFVYLKREMSAETRRGGREEEELGRGLSSQMWPRMAVGRHQRRMKCWRRGKRLDELAMPKMMWRRESGELEEEEEEGGLGERGVKGGERGGKMREK